MVRALVSEGEVHIPSGITVQSLHPILEAGWTASENGLPAAGGAALSACSISLCERH